MEYNQQPQRAFVLGHQHPFSLPFLAQPDFDSGETLSFTLIHVCLATLTSPLARGVGMGLSPGQLTPHIHLRLLYYSYTPHPIHEQAVFL